MFFEDFHPAVAGLVPRAPSRRRPTAQAAAWPAIRAGRHTLVAAPTGSGKTLTAFLAALDALVREGLQPGGLADETDGRLRLAAEGAVERHPPQPRGAARRHPRRARARWACPTSTIRTAVRTGDTPPRERRAEPAQGRRTSW